MIIKNLIRKFKESAFWKSVATLSLGQIIATLINILSAPILSRIYDNEAYGSFAIVTSTATIVIGFIGLGLGSAIMIPEDIEETKKILVTNFYFQVILAALVSIIFIIIMPFHQFFSSPKIPYIVLVLIMFLYIVLTVLSSLMSVYINKLKMDNLLLFNPLFGAIISLVVTIPAGLLGFNFVGLYIAYIISTLLMNIYMIKKANPFTFKIVLADVFAIIKKYNKFVKYQYPSNLIGILSNQSPNQFLGYYFGTNSLGDYAMTNRVFGMPFALLANPIQRVYFRTISIKYNNGEDISGFTYSLIIKLMLIALIPLIAVMSFGEQIFAFILGSNWSVAGILASILALPIIFNFCYNCITYARVTIQKQKINFYTSIFQLAIIVISIVIGYMVYGTLLGTIFCYAIGSLIFYIVNIGITFYCFNKYTLRFFIFSILYCAFCIALTLLLKA